MNDGRLENRFMGFRRVENCDGGSGCCGRSDSSNPDSEKGAGKESLPSLSCLRTCCAGFVGSGSESVFEAFPRLLLEFRRKFWGI